MRKLLLTLITFFSIFHSFAGEKFNIGLCITATGRYSEFAQTFVESCRKHFFKDHNVTYFIFTDDENYPEKPDEMAVYQKRLGWPYDTLMRFEIYLKNKHLLKDMDYVFACDADMLYVSDVGEDMLGDLIGTRHPGFYDKSRSQFSYETRRHSTACIKPSEGQYYFAGGFYGGNLNEFIKLLEVTSRNIKRDLKKDFIAVWHDESHLNRYFVDNPPTKMLSPAYCYPESWDIPFQKKMLALDKNHAEVRK